MVILRATLGRMVRIFCWLFTGSLVLVTAALGLMSYIFATTPWHDEDCDDYECRGQIEVSRVSVRSEQRHRHPEPTHTQFLEGAAEHAPVADGVSANGSSSVQDRELYSGTCEEREALWRGP